MATAILARAALPLAFLSSAAFAGTAGAADTVPHGAMLRYPDVSSTEIVFVYSNDIWLVPREGGSARPLASPPGTERHPKFDPAGRTIAFVGNYDGDTDLYTIPAVGGVPTRITHHPTNESLCDWIGDDEILMSAWGMTTNPRTSGLLRVAANGGLPTPLPVPYGAAGAISDDGRWLAYTPHNRDYATWKRYRGGDASDVWLFDLTTLESRQVTDWEGTDTRPMWHDRQVYYLSDAGPRHRLNIWVYDTETHERRQVTTHGDYDVKWPSIGPGPSGGGEIVYQLGSRLRLLDLGTGKSREVDIRVPGARPALRQQQELVGPMIRNRSVSPTGKRVVVEARGDVWTLPAGDGTPINLTRTSGVAERDPAWSPDGRWIAFFSDASGEYELTLMQSDGRTEPEQKTDLAGGFYYRIHWSPDSERIAFWDQLGRVLVYDFETDRVTEVDRVPGGFPQRVSWSSDSRWLAYRKSAYENTPPAIWVYDADEDARHQLTEGMFADTWPTFDREGKYMYFASQREISSPRYADYGTTWIYTRTDRLYVVPLQADTPSPFLAENDEESWDDESATDDEGTESDEGDDEETEDEETEDEDAEDDGDEDDDPEPVIIDIDGFERRVIQIPVDRGAFWNLAVNDGGQLLYTRAPVPGSGGSGTIHLIDVEDGDPDDLEKSVYDGAGAFEISNDGAKILVVDGSRMAVLSAAEGQSFEDPIATDNLRVTLDPRAEWNQMFVDAWRLYRDFFYDPNLHGVDWPAVRRQYGAMLADCVSREDVSYVLAEMISELNVGHAYLWSGGDVESPPYVSVGMLGCDFAIDSGAYRISRIYSGAAWDTDARGPLGQPGVDVREGDYLLAVNGVPLDVSKDPWAAFIGLADRTITLTVSEEPEMSDAARDVVVEAGSSEFYLRHRHWVEAKRQYVAERTDGRVGYIYVPNTGIDGQDELNRQFVGQLHRDALIIDERWNGGGQVPTRFIELLNRPVVNYWARRYTETDAPWPPDSHQGPKCMLINGSAGSGGDYFPYLFRKAGLGKIIGMRTWGGLVGISGNPELIDGGYLTIPNFAFYETDGTWGIEGHGVEPDIEVVDDPALMVDGGDPQLDRAIDVMLDELETNPYRWPGRPAYPNRSGMGLAEADR